MSSASEVAVSILCVLTGIFMLYILYLFIDPLIRGDIYIMAIDAGVDAKIMDLVVMFWGWMAYIVPLMLIAFAIWNSMRVQGDYLEE